MLLTGNLKHGEYITTGDKRVVFLDHNQYKIGDRIQECYKNDNQVIIDNDVGVFLVVPEEKTLSHYENANGDKMSVNDYNAEIKKYRDEDWDEHYPDLDTEYAHKLRLAKMREEFKQVFDVVPESYVPVELSCVGEVVDPDSDFIDTSVSQGQATFSNSGLYRVNHAKLTAVVLKEFVVENNLHEFFINPDHGGVRFAKIKGEYVMSDRILGAQRPDYRIFKDLQAAKDAVDSHRKCLIRHLKIAVFGDEVEVKKINLKELLVDIQWIKGRVDCLDVKKAGLHEKSSILARLNDKINKYKALIDDE